MCIKDFSHIAFNNSTTMVSVRTSDTELSQFSGEGSGGIES